MDVNKPTSKEGFVGIDPSTKTSPKKLYLIGGIAVVLLIIVTVVGFKAMMHAKKGEPTMNVGTNMPTNNEQTITLPINLDNPALSSATVNYVFETIIKAVKVENNTVRLSTQLDDTPGLPAFVVTTKTPVGRIRNFSFTPVAIAALAPNQKIRMSVTYTPKTKTLAVTSIAIIENDAFATASGQRR